MLRRPGITTGVATIATRYTITSFDAAARPLGSLDAIYAARDGHTCASSLPLASRAASNGYTILRITTTRPGSEFADRFAWREL